MRIVAINGSPRKNKNTATLLKKVLEGAADAFAPETIETELVNLYDLTYTGCRSCFACKLKGKEVPVMENALSRMICILYWRNWQMRMPLSLVRLFITAQLPGSSTLSTNGSSIPI